MKTTAKIMTLPCGCKYEDDGYLVVRVHECAYHKRMRTRKRPYRPHAESVRP